MKIKPFILAFALSLLTFNIGNLLAEDITGGILEGKVNGNDEDYNPYVIFGQNTDTLFFTSSRPVQNKGAKQALNAEIFYCTRPSSLRKTGSPPNVGWSEAKQIIVNEKRIAGFTKGSQAVSDDRIIFAAERDISSSGSSGTSYLLDLWQMLKTADGFSSPEPLGLVNDADSWDSQPALSGDSKTLFFVSNRKGGQGGLDIWYSVRDDQGHWSAASPVPNINTPGDEVSPCCGNDGNFYFSTNWDYSAKTKKNNKDIYRANYQSINGLELPSNPVNLDIALQNDANKYGLQIPKNIKYNSDFDDEFPFITQDRKDIYLTSNRKSDLGKRNIYGFSLPKSKISVQVNISERIFDTNDSLIVPPTPKFGLALTLVDSIMGTSQIIKSGEKYEVDADRVYIVKFSKFVEDECYKNKIEDKSEEKDNKIITFRPFWMDTLFQKDFLVSRKKIDIPPIIFKATEKLPFFITGYWYPNTSSNLKEFRQREASGFFDQSGFVDSSDYDYELTSKTIDQLFEEKIFKPLEKVLSIFQDFCRDTLYLKATIHGYTDPRGLSGGEDHAYRPQSKYKHNYSDETVTVGVDERGNPVVISQGIDMWKQSWPKNANDKNGTWIKLPDEGENGNILLSKLRAYYTFKTFDKVMAERSPIYKQLRENNRIILDAEGFGIDKKGFELRNLKDDPESRRIEIYLDILRPGEIASHKRIIGGDLVIDKKKVPVKIVKNENPQPILERQITPKTPVVTEKPITPKTPDEIVKPNIENKTPIEKVPEKNPETEKIAESKSVNIKKVQPSQPIATLNDCYSIQYKTYDDESEANKALAILKENNIQDPSIMIFIDPIGNISYRLRSGCFKTGEEAVAEMTKNKWINKLLNLTKSPVIVK